MSKKQWIIVTVPVLIIVIGLILLVAIPGPKSTAEPSQQPSDTAGAVQPGSASASSTSVATQAVLDDTIKVAAPLINTKVHSPLTITGQARGNWYFEASAPVELLDGNGKVLTQGHITATADWMTSDYVPFTAVLTFATPTTKTGTLVLKNDNPSGDPSREKELDIPVTF